MINETNQNIMSAIEMIVGKKIEKLQNNDKMGIVVGTKTIKNKTKYIVVIEGNEYLVKDGIRLTPMNNTKVWVHLPNGNMEDAYIAAQIT